MNNIRLGKEISYALRHHPEKYHLSMDDEGWVEVDELLNALSSKYGKLSEEDIVELMKNSDKQRYELKDHRIRAYYGHSFDTMIVKEKQVPPTILYHGTARRFLDSIYADGLKSMTRQYVHLSKDIETARTVGSRHDDHPVILKVKALEAYKDGIGFYLGNETVWLSDDIPVKYIEQDNLE